MDKKISLLTLIRDKKEVLFGRFNPSLTNQDKRTAWEEVCTRGKSLAIIPNDKDWTYARDTTYGNWKSRTLAKTDNRNQTGRGGSVAKLTELDHLILDIIGKDSPIILGLDVPESMEETVEPVVTGRTDLSSVPSTSTPIRPKTSTTPTFPSQSEFEVAKEKRRKKWKLEEEMAKKKKMKIDLQVDVLKIEKRKKLMELFKLEQDLGLPASELTLDIHLEQGMVRVYDPEVGI